MQDRSFLGRGWAFPPTFDTRSGAAALVSAEEDIRQSLRILLATTPGERVMQPSYGCALKAMVFEHINDSTVTDIKDVIQRAILFFEPRITLDLIDLDESEWLEGILRVSLHYTVRSTNTRSNLVFPLYLREGSAVGNRA